MNDLRYWIAFNRAPQIGPVKLRRLLEYFGDLERAWHADAGALKDAGLDRRALENLLATRADLDLDAALDQARHFCDALLTWDDAAYPKLLRQIPDPPPLLYVKGALKAEDEWALAVVGTRRATAYGREVTRALANDLARNKITIVSGLARGIDAEAHRAALDAGGRTLAVLANGLDQVYPPEHTKLAREICQHGALISDYPIGTRPESANFPPRNRIISGLALGVLFTEGDTTSGARITVDFALEQGREVFAVPGNILRKESRGPNHFIQQGAKAVLSVQDILEELNLTQVVQQQEVRAAIPENADEAALLKYLSAEPVHVDELRQQTGLPIAQVSATLALMELKGLVRQTSGMNYILAREARAEYGIE